MISIKWYIHVELTERSWMHIKLDRVSIHENMNTNSYYALHEH